jgi:hypothetical protein
VKRDGVGELVCGHCQVVGLKSRWRATRRACSWLRPDGDASGLGPNLKGLGAGGSILRGGHPVTAEVKEVADPIMGGEEALRLAGRLEPLHLTLSPSRRLVRVLRPVVQPLVLSVLDRGHHLAPGRPVARQLVGHHDTRWAGLLFQQLAQQAFGGPCVAPALHQDVQHHPGLVDHAPQPVLHPGDRQHDFVHVPLVPGCRQPAADLVGEHLAELQRPLADSFMADDDAARGQQFIDHPQAEREAEVEPNGMADDLGRETVAGVAGNGGRYHPARLPGSAPSHKPASPKLTVPLKRSMYGRAKLDLLRQRLLLAA